MSDVTRILDRTNEGDPNAAEELRPLVYGELRKRHWAYARAWLYRRITTSG